jgi:hypothetical protein
LPDVEDDKEGVEGWDWVCWSHAARALWSTGHTSALDFCSSVMFCLRTWYQTSRVGDGKSFVSSEATGQGLG